MAVAILTPEELEQLLERAAEKGAARAMAQGGSGILSTAQAARIAGRSEETIRDWCASGVLPAGRRGKARWAIRREDLDRYLAGHRDGAPRSNEEILRSLGGGGSSGKD